MRHETACAHLGVTCVDVDAPKAPLWRLVPASHPAAVEDWRGTRVPPRAVVVPVVIGTALDARVDRAQLGRQRVRERGREMR